MKNLFEWFGRNHDAVEAIAAVAAALVAFLALFRPLITGWFGKWKDWRERRAETRAEVAVTAGHELYFRSMVGIVTYVPGI